MLLSFYVENWMSYSNPATLSMLATNERQHGNRVAKVPKFKARVLPVAAIYGGNASGKTNLFRALAFAKQLVTEPPRTDMPIPVVPFLLGDESSRQTPTSFGFEVLYDELMYEYTFSVTQTEVVEEKLVRINSTSEVEVFTRHAGDVKINEAIADKDLALLATRAVRANQLFLSTGVQLNVPVCMPVFYWFRDCLELNAPDSRFEPFEMFFDKEDQLFTVLQELLERLDTGVKRLDIVDFPLDTYPLPAEIRKVLEQEVREGVVVRLLSAVPQERLLISRVNGELVGKNLVAVHGTQDDHEVAFEVAMESDGTQRLIDLLPAFLGLAAADSTKVYVVDEIDRSLHTSLVRELISTYLLGCDAQSRTQLLFTTHDVMMLDQALLRRDETWFTDKDSQVSSKLIGLADYKDVRLDKDIRKSYLQGRFGGVPSLFLPKNFGLD